MNPVSFYSLLLWELRQLKRSQLLWTTIAGVSALLLIGLFNTASLHKQQTADQRNTQAKEASWMSEVRERAVRYARPAEGASLPYWQDPTDVAGFSRYYLLQHALKPQLPLSALAIGNSDLLPTRLPLKLDTPFGIAPVYDFEPPRGLSLGTFDTSFVIVYLLPLAIVLLLALLTTYEHDHGMLRLIASHTVTSRTWLSARVLAIAVWVVPAVLLAIVITLSVTGVALISAWGELFAALTLVLLYQLFWFALGYAVLARWQRGTGAAGTLVTSWAVLIIGIPLLINVIASIATPTPSRIQQIDAERRIDEALPREEDAVLAAMFRSRVDRVNAIERIPQLDYATLMTFLIPEIERRFSMLHEATAADQKRNQQLSDIAGYLVPSLGVESALATLAGTDNKRHQHFEQQTRQHQLKLREFFFPRVQREIATPTPKPLLSSYGRMNFTDYDSVPRFEMRDGNAQKRVSALLPTAACLLSLSILLFVTGYRNARQWPTDID